jgi:predicted O-methyltransferase YrrM
MVNDLVLAVPTALFGAAALARLDAKRRKLIPLRLRRTFVSILLDMLSPALALAFAIFQLVRFMSGLPEFAMQRLVEALLSAAIFFFLWREGRRANQFQRPNGIVFGEFLVLVSVARSLSHATAHSRPFVDAWSIGGLIFGVVLIAWVVPRFLKKREEHHIIARIEEQGEARQPEYTPSTHECPHPERWTMIDSMSAEVEILDFLKQLVLTLKPEVIVETGTFLGQSSIKMAEAVRTNGFGRIVTCEFDPLVYRKAQERIEASGLAHWISCRNQSSLELEVDGKIDLFFSDSHQPIREQEIRRFLPQISPQGLILMHDTSSHYRIAREAAFRLEAEGLISMVLLPTPRGLMIAQKRAGRK